MGFLYQVLVYPYTSLLSVELSPLSRIIIILNRLLTIDLEIGGTSADYIFMVFFYAKWVCGS